MIRKFANLLNERIFFREYSIDTQSIQTVIGQINHGNEKDPRVQTLRRIEKGEYGHVMHISVQEFVGEDIKRYVDFKTSKGNVRIDYVLKAQKKEENTLRSAWLEDLGLGW